MQFFRLTRKHSSTTRLNIAGPEFVHYYLRPNLWYSKNICNTRKAGTHHSNRWLSLEI